MTHDRVLGPLVRTALDQYGWTDCPIYYGQLPDVPAEYMVAVRAQGGTASDRAVPYDFPAFIVTVRAREPLIAELIAQTVHQELHGRDFVQDGTGRIIWTLQATGSPQLANVRSKTPRFEWTFELTSMMDRS